MNRESEIKISIIIFVVVIAIFSLGYTVGVGEASIECVDKVQAVIR